MLTRHSAAWLAVLALPPGLPTALSEMRGSTP